jgi:nucleoporin NUP1
VGFIVNPVTYLYTARPVNAAEKALHELDIYKTPLLPSRLRGSTTIPDMFKPKLRRSHMPILMHSEKDEKPRLGKSKRREVNGSKPYAGEGGMKKLLARRKLEEEDERRKEYNAESTGEKTVSTAEKRQQQNSTPVLTFGSSIDTTASYEKSSLRVGRTRTSRNHISRPASRSNNRFSAVYDEEESDDQMLEVKSADQIASEEAAKKVPAFGVPAGFSFAKEVCF